MKHLSEEELIGHREGEGLRREEISTHLSECDECRAESQRIEEVLKALDTLPVPDAGEDYGRRVWQQIAPRLEEKRARWWEIWMEPRRMVAFGAIATLIVVAFFVGRLTKRRDAGPAALSAGQVRERVLVVAVGEHLGKSEMMLVELSNAEPRETGQKEVNISSEQRRAEDLLEENRLYRQTALQEGDAGLASVLDELERVLLDVAHSPQEVTPAQLEGIRKRIEAQGILFKVRVVGKELQKKQEAPAPEATPRESAKKEGNRA